ncbi:MAG: CamS family sex pheromone protein [Erysipelotrichaceae bacterium]
MKIVRLALVALLLLSGCQDVEINDGENDVVIESVIDGEYSFILPYTVNDARQVHNMYKRSIRDVETIGTGLLELSKQHFSPNEYWIKDGELIGYNQLISLLRRSSADNTYGLNPESGSMFPNGEGIEIENAVIVNDIYEVDFYKQSSSGYQLEGLSFAIVLSPNQSVDDGLYGTTVTITDEALFAYGSEAAIRFEQYLRTLPEVGNLPILLTLYKAGSTDANLPGSYMGYGLFDSRSTKMTQISEEWVLFPSSRASSLDPLTTSQFNEIKNSLHLFLPEDIGIIGQGKYQNDSLQQLNLTVTMQAKTYLEIQGLVQYLASLLPTFVDADYTIQIEVKSAKETKAIIVKEPKKDLAITLLD